jgi:hypothetical protein
MPNDEELLLASFDHESFEIAQEKGLVMANFKCDTRTAAKSGEF